MLISTFSSFFYSHQRRRGSHAHCCTHKAAFFQKKAFFMPLLVYITTGNLLSKGWWNIILSYSNNKWFTHSFLPYKQHFQWVNTWKSGLAFFSWGSKFIEDGANKRQGKYLPYKSILVKIFMSKVCWAKMVFYMYYVTHAAILWKMAKPTLWKHYFLVM